MSSHDLRTQLRYDSDVQIQFQVSYSFRTEVDFAVDEPLPETKYIGFSRNISVNGLCIESNKELRADDNLLLDVHIPNSDEVIHMQGVVRWAQLGLVTPQTPKIFLAGIAISHVDGVGVDDTIYFDQKYGVYWSELLERVLGSFAQLYKKKSHKVVLRGILQDSNGRILMMRRSPKSKSWPLMWEFPGGKADPGETAVTTLKREFLEEVSLEIRPLHRFIDFIYDCDEGNIEYHIYFVERISGEPQISHEHVAMGWFSLEEMSTIDISPPLLDVIEHLKNPTN